MNLVRLALWTLLLSGVLSLPTNVHGAEPPPRGISTFPEDAAFPGQGPIRKYDWFTKHWIERRTQWWNDREQDRGAVVFLGDSITQGWETLAQDFPDLKVANRGISGDVTRGVLYRLKEDVLDLNPAAVVLLIGTNDLEEGGEPAVIANNVNEIVGACRKAHPRLPVVLCIVMPSSGTKKRPAAQIKDLNARLAALATSHPDVTLCDTWTPFANAEGDARTDEFPDLLHPNAAGYAKWTSALRPVFAKLRLGAGRQ
jgi:lysophospholipase L1-like esterase